ncbi:UNKNOWN [Stylonychia lemnae]|uniref:ApaG domain-containing protein n=1 Tax=Stylonychia lemnae TaxID=5949 RepID=A0A078AHH4_STYLE|nr:UNKNOWN [Stylonychia lemnae]|eukprot:CDW81296.1 UNKNOWN [Stylonychia lemnae]
METLSQNSKLTLNDTLDHNLASVLLPYLTLNDYISGVYRINKMFSSFYKKGADFIWKTLFELEFHDKEYPDHKIEEGESWHSYFKRSFEMYKKFRRIWAGIITMSNRKSVESQDGYLRDFNDRTTEKYPLFQLEVFYKVFRDPAQIKDIEDVYSGGNFYESLQNFVLHTTEFYEYELEVLMLSPASLLILQNIINVHLGILVYPILHTKNYKHSVILDYQNLFNQGVGALISWGGPDRSQVQVLGLDLMNFLEDHYDKLERNQFFSANSRIESFFNPVQGREIRQLSVAVTNGIRIEACAKYIHHFSIFDLQYHSQRRYYFTYQIRVMVDPDHEGEFDDCQLTTRHWEIYTANSSVPEVVDGAGVIGLFPHIRKNGQIFSYQSATYQTELGGRMQGWFEFKYLKGEKKGETFKATIEPFELSLDEGTKLIQNPIFEPWMHQL